MKIAIVAPSHVPFIIGGAENLWWGLLRTINEFTPHMAELIKLPSPENDFKSIVKSYKTFANLDLSHFDCIISTKYPAWMTRHPNHICYLQHKLRGLYDTYHLGNSVLEYKSRLTAIIDLKHFMCANWGRREALAEFFERVEALYADPDMEQDAFDFPGPFIREIVHFMDGVALAPGSIRKYATISKNVLTRENYFPEGVHVDIIHHPPFLQGFYKGDAHYLFTASRLDEPKRIDLLIEALGHVKSDVNFLIAGTGPDEQRLKQMARNDHRVRFLGYVGDDELINYYANALAILYAPYDEDLGLITIEAMMSEKPVIVTKDSGGPNEFVRDGENGFSVSPDPHSIGEKIEILCQDPRLAIKLGKFAKDTVRDITWKNTVARLLDGNNENRIQPHRGPKQKITVVTTFQVYPPRGGGQHRVYHLYRNLTHWFDIELVTLSNPGETGFDEIIAPGMKEIRVPKSKEHAHKEFSRYESKVNVPVTDVAFSILYKLTPEFVTALEKSTQDADFVVASHPYCLPAIREVYKGPIWYEAHNIEFELKKGILPDNPVGRRLLEATREVESACCKECELLMVCCQEDGETLNRLYGADLAKVIEVPNGVDLSSVTYNSLEQRAALKSRLGLDSHFLALFMGSWHGPNLEAMEFLIHLAEKLRHITFLMLGSGGLYFENKLHPPNVLFLGVVDEETKDVVLGAADVALNPMSEGSGTNLKVLDYMAAGVPMISTSFGSRGLRVRHKREIIIAELDQFEDAIHEMQNEETHLKSERILAARRHVEKNFDWTVIAKKFARDAARRGGA